MQSKDRLSRVLLQTEFSFGESSPSQGPDLNRSVVDLQSTAWPLRHLGLAWISVEEMREIFTERLWISSGFEKHG